MHAKLLQIMSKLFRRLKLPFEASVIACVLFSLLYWCECDEFEKCHESAYYKPYVKLMKKKGGKTLNEIRETGFIDLAERTNIIICINGPAILYRNATLLVDEETALDTAEISLPPISHYTKAKMGVFEHHCMAINKVMKQDILMARAGALKQRIINLDQQIYGVYLIGNKDDYRQPQIAQFNDSKFSYIVNDSSPNSTHAFALIGNPSQAFCTNFTSIDEEGIRHTHCVKFQMGVEEPSICFKSGGGGGPFDTAMNGMTSDAYWESCNAQVKTNVSDEREPFVVKPEGNEYLAFATFSKGGGFKKLDEEPPTTNSPIETENCNSTNGTCKEEGVSHHKRCELVETEIQPSHWFCNYRHTWTVEPLEQCKTFPRLEDSVKCDPNSRVGKLTNNKCYFWQHTADTWIDLNPYSDLFWRYNLLDDMRKVIQRACPQVPIDMIILCNQIFIGYLKHVYRQSVAAGNGSSFLKHQYPEWETELQPAIGFCRNKSVPMDFQYLIKLPESERPYRYDDAARTLGMKIPFENQTNISEVRDVEEFEEAEHIEMRKPPHPSDFFRNLNPVDVTLNNETLFFYREGIELEKDFNFALDVVWKAFSIAAGYCNAFYQNKKPELFPRLYNAFYDDFMHFVEEYWKSDADNEDLKYVIEEFMENDDVQTWLDVCLEGAYIFSESQSYRPPRPLVFIEQKKMVANYFLELPNDVDILTSAITTPRLNLFKKHYPQLYSCHYGGANCPSTGAGRRMHEVVKHKKTENKGSGITTTPKPSNVETVIETHSKIKGKIMG